MKVELVASLKHQATRILADLRKFKEPVLITEHGRPSAYLTDVEDFESMQSRMLLLEDIARGEAAILDNRTYPAPCQGSPRSRSISAVCTVSAAISISQRKSEASNGPISAVNCGSRSLA